MDKRAECHFVLTRRLYIWSKIFKLLMHGRLPPTLAIFPVDLSQIHRELPGLTKYYYFADVKPTKMHFLLYTVIESLWDLLFSANQFLYPQTTRCMPVARDSDKPKMPEYMVVVVTLFTIAKLLRNWNRNRTFHTRTSHKSFFTSDVYSNMWNASLYLWQSVYIYGVA